jgi:CheY-like chemotaxis protein
MVNSRTLEALFPGPRRQIISAFFGEPERWWSLADLAGRAGIQTGSLRQHVTPLRDCGLLRQKRVAGHALFQADPASPIFGELRSIVSVLSSQADATETILVVEDQPATAQITRILLESWGYKVLEAHSGTEALRLFEKHSGLIRLLLSDVNMPEKSGPELAGELQRQNPDLRVIFMSGYPRDEGNCGEASFLPKPFNPASLSRIVRRELDRRHASPHHMNIALD